MGEIQISKIGELERGANTLEQYDKPINESRFKYVVERLSEQHIIHDSEKVCYIFGMGKHPSSTYEKLNTMQGAEVIWYGSLFPLLLKPLSVLIASYAGLVRIKDKSLVSNIFEKLSELSMVGFYLFSKDLEQEFVNTVKSKKYSQYADTIVKKDPSYFIYQVDADNTESPTGIYEIVSYGKKCPEELVSILKVGA